jgi:tetratricopeptide (TPR) repeat protein
VSPDSRDEPDAERLDWELASRILGDQACCEAMLARFRRPSFDGLDPRICARGLNWLGHVLVQRERFAEAEACFRKALEAPDDPVRTAERLSNLGVALGQLGRLDEELDCYERALALSPSPLARFNHAISRLRMGDFAGGWPEYESRWGRGAPQGGSRRAFAEPAWDGSPLDGRRILLYAEQGLGDTLQFVRYAPLVAAAGGRVILEVPASLERLLVSVEGIEAVVQPDGPRPEFDLQCPLLSLPGIFGTTVETIPDRVPYLAPSEEARRAWERRLASVAGLRVGLVWAGSQHHGKDRTRSMPLGTLLGFLPAGQELSLHAFQVGPRRADLAGAPLPVLDLAPELTDFNETAAALLQMDLLLTIDTSVAHLGGALGVETWLCLPSVADWRWLSGRADSPWYPGMRLFRQPAPGDWASVVERVRRELAGSAAARARDGRQAGARRLQ